MVASQSKEVEKCLGYIRVLLKDLPNLVFLIAARYGLDYENEHRKEVKSTIHVARTTICNYHVACLNHPSIRTITSVQDPDR